LLELIFREIAKIINEEGHPKQGGKWSAEAVRLVLARVLHVSKKTRQSSAQSNGSGNESVSRKFPDHFRFVDERLYEIRVFCYRV
jgi:hypothetical protein